MAKKEIKLKRKLVIKGVHPGIILSEELEARGISQTRLAQHIKVHPKVINEICRGKRGLSVEMSIKLSKALGTSTVFWLGLQQDYELAQIDQDDYDYIEKLSA